MIIETVAVVDMQVDCLGHTRDMVVVEVMLPDGIQLPKIPLAQKLFLVGGVLVEVAVVVVLLRCKLGMVGGQVAVVVVVVGE